MNRSRILPFYMAYPLPLYYQQEDTDELAHIAVISEAFEDLKRRFVIARLKASDCVIIVTSAVHPPYAETPRDKQHAQNCGDRIDSCFSVSHTCSLLSRKDPAAGGTP